MRAAILTVQTKALLAARANTTTIKRATPSGENKGERESTAEKGQRAPATSGYPAFRLAAHSLRRFIYFVWAFLFDYLALVDRCPPPFFLFFGWVVLSFYLQRFLSFSLGIHRVPLSSFRTCTSAATQRLICVIRHHVAACKGRPTGASGTPNRVGSPSKHESHHGSWMTLPQK